MRAGEAADLFRRHNQELFRYLLRFTCGDATAAQDAVQHAFVKLLESTKPIQRPRAWLYRVATNAVLTWSRRERWRAEELAAHGTEPPGSSPGPEPPDAALDKREVRSAVRAALAQLEPRERTILLMREEGFKHREIAEAVGTTTGSVGTMAARALEKLSLRLPLDAELTL